MKSIFARLAVPAFLLLPSGGIAAQEQQPENIVQENSDAVARKLFSTLIERQIGAPVAPDRFWAYEVDFNLDGFSEIYGFVDRPNCDGLDCGLFLFVLQGDSYREALGTIPGARLTDPTKVFLGAFKRDGFLELQLDRTLASWSGDHYADLNSLAATSLNGAAYLEACRSASSNEVQQQGDADAAIAACECRFTRFQAIGFTQAHLDAYVTYMTNYREPEGADAGWRDALRDASDVEMGCNVKAGKSQWDPAFFQHGERQQTERLDFDGFIDACKREEWIVGQHKIGSPDRALGLCACLAREMPTYGATQVQLDLLTQYYDGEASDADLDAQQPDLLDWHDTASQACLDQFPEK